MSRAIPLSNTLRIAHYLAQTGRVTLTKRQARQVRRKDKAHTLWLGKALIDETKEWLEQQRTQEQQES